MDDKLLNAIMGAAKTVSTYEEGALIFREGDIPKGVYLVQNGAVSLVRGGKWGRAADSGEILALSAIIGKRVHESSAIASSRCEVAFIERSELLRKLEDAPTVWFAILHFLSREVNGAYDEIRSIATKQRSSD